MKQIHDDFRRGQDEMSAAGSPQQAVALEVWFDLQECIRYARAMIGTPPVARCVKLRILPLRPDIELEPIEEHEYKKAMADARRIGKAWFLKHAGRDPQSAVYDSLLSTSIVEWAKGAGKLLDFTGKPMGSMSMPAMLLSKFSQTPE